MLIELPQKVAHLLEKAGPSDIRFIKLGAQSKWWPVARNSKTIRLGFHEAPFDLCKAGRWDDVKQAVSRAGIKTAQQAANQIRDFFELPPSTLWITIEDGDVWWAFAESGVANLETRDSDSYKRTGSRSRNVIDRWRNTDVEGDRLRIDSMTTKITKVMSFQGTICKPDGATDILRRIRRLRSPAHQRTDKAANELIQSVGDLLDQLHQDDFELLVELVFSSSGWRRISATGGTMKTADIVLTLPTTGETSFVQVKSQTNWSTLKTYVEALKNQTGYNRMFFVYHTPVEPLPNPSPEKVTVWSRYDIARQVVDAGLVRWVLARTT